MNERSSFLTRCANFLRRFRRGESGVATIEFVIVFPAYFLLVTSAYEAGMLMTRHVMLERGLDATVREVRIGRIPFPTHDNLTDRICEVASIIPNCKYNLRLEMISRNPRSWQDIPPEVACVDREEPNLPVVQFNPALNNELLVLRACALFDPMIPLTGLGKEIPKKSGGAYGLLATSSYVMEPFK